MSNDCGNNIKNMWKLQQHYILCSSDKNVTHERNIMRSLMVMTECASSVFNARHGYNYLTNL